MEGWPLRGGGFGRAARSARLRPWLRLARRVRSALSRGGRAMSPWLRAERNLSAPAGTICMPRRPGGGLDAFARGHFGVFDAQRRVLELQQRAALERAPDAGVELQQAQLQRDDPDQRERDHPIQVRPRIRRSTACARRPAQARAPEAGRPARRGWAPGATRRGRAGPETRRGRGAASSAVGRRGRRCAAPDGGAAAVAAGGVMPSACVVELPGRAQARRARRAGCAATSPADGTIERRAQQRRLGLAPARAHRQVGRADAAPGALGQEALDAAVLERVEGDAGQHAALAQQLPGQRQRGVELLQLVVDGDPERLERALGGMAAGEARRARGSRP